MYIGKITLIKAKTEENIADALTKAANAEMLEYHVVNSSGGCRRDRHRKALEVTDEEEKIEGCSEQVRWHESVVADDGNHGSILRLGDW